MVSISNHFERVEIPYRGSIITIEELPASVTPDVLEECEKMRADGATEVKISDHLICRLCAASVIENGKHLSEDEQAAIALNRPRKWFTTVWDSVNKLNGITGDEREKVDGELEKNSDEVEHTASTSTDSAVTSDS
jgi:hypothetical protein